MAGVCPRPAASARRAPPPCRRPRSCAVHAATQRERTVRPRTSIHHIPTSRSASWRLPRAEMAQASLGTRVAAAMLALAVLAPHLTVTAQRPPTADNLIAKDRIFRLSAGKSVAKPVQLGFFGTIFHLILEQINDTKSAYNQVSELVSNQFTDDSAPTSTPDPTGNETTTESTKISRQEFLKILDRNLKGLARLRALEWREARKDSWNNIRGYKDEIFRGKKSRKRRRISHST
ncbi:hypothetical protein O0L34_g9634 [Tuta absoluta]|nr:hypothetical protein O0L34_g9634 [Tuta absoluta]